MRSLVLIHDFLSIVRLSTFRPYAKKLVEVGYEMDIRGQRTTAAELYDNLINTINNVYEDVVNSGSGVIDQVAHPMEYELFHNPYRVVDGPW